MSKSVPVGFRARDENQAEQLKLTAQFLGINTNQAVKQAVDRFIAAYAEAVAEWLPAREAAQATAERIREEMGDSYANA